MHGPNACVENIYILYLIYLNVDSPNPLLNPISHELWNDVITRGGAIMARMDSSHPEAVSRHSRAQN